VRLYLRMPPPASETQLLFAARSGDRGAFTRLVAESAPTLERLALRLVGHRQDAEDVAQDAVLSAWRELGGFRGGARFRTWVCRILVRKALDLLRRRRPVPVSAPGPSGTVEPVTLVAQQETERLLRAAIDDLPPVQRATLLLRADQGLSYEEIAYVLGSNRNAVRMNLLLARKRLGERLKGVIDR